MPGQQANGVFTAVPPAEQYLSTGYKTLKFIRHRILFWNSIKGLASILLHGHVVELQKKKRPFTLYLSTERFPHTEFISHVCGWRVAYFVVST